jgi:hypothetical protein
MRLKPKLAQYWHGRFVARRDEVNPFPGEALLRWAIYLAANGTLKYEGKPSTQALEFIERYTTEHGRKLTLVEFDKGGPIAVADCRGTDMVFTSAYWGLWEKYHGHVNAHDFYHQLRRNRRAIPKNAQAR